HGPAVGGRRLHHRVGRPVRAGRPGGHLGHRKPEPCVKCELVAVGTELLLGQIVDTNSAWIGEQLALAGIDSHYHTKVGDNWERIRSTLELALSRSDA